MNTKAKGEISEGHILAHLLKRGYVVSVPFGNNQRYDLIVDDGERLWRAQAKTARMHKGCLVFNCSSTGYNGRREAYHDQIDLFLVYSPDADKVYRIPIKEATATEMMLRIEPTKPRSPLTTIKWAANYEFA
jgi:hypothetical protein